MTDRTHVVIPPGKSVCSCGEVIAGGPTLVAVEQAKDPAEAERDRIVLFLRREADRLAANGERGAGMALHVAAKDVERGEHLT